MSHKTCKFLSILLTLVLFAGAMTTTVSGADAKKIPIVKFDYTKPEVGESIADYIAARKVSIPADAGYTLSYIVVQHDNGGYYEDVEETEFLKNTRYHISFFMELKPGYTIDYDKDYYNEVPAWLNGRQWDGQFFEEDGLIYVAETIILDKVKIYEFQIDITEPAVGKTPVFNAKVLTIPAGGIDDTYLNVTWYESDDESMTSARKMVSSDVFKPGKYYATVVDEEPVYRARSMKLKDGYYIGDRYSIDIYNGYFSNNPDYTTIYGPLSGSSAPVDEPPAIAAVGVSEVFTDVPDNAWYLPYLQKAFDSGIVGGTTTDTYTPNGNLNHGQIMVMAANLHSAQKGDHYDFQANKKAGEAWYQVFEDYCKKEGIIDNRFDGKENQNVNRAEMAYYFANTLTESSYMVKKDIVLNDIEGSGYEEEINKLANADIVGGKGAGKYDPSGLVIRAEAAVFISNILDAIGE